MKPRIVIQFIVTAQEKRAIQRAARRERRSVSDFIRNAAAERMSIDRAVRRIVREDEQGAA